MGLECHVGGKKKKTGFDDFTSPQAKRRTMPRTRASSVVSDVKSSRTPAAENDVGHHRLRSRKNINYMTPPLDDDSFQEKPDLEPSPIEYKEYRELRSSTRALAKITAVQDSVEPEVWNSGRPKRACINRQKRISADERLVSDNKTYYKVEVLSSKLRTSDRDKGNSKQKESKGNSSEKGLIVKFKKLRNSDDTSEDDEGSENDDESNEEDDEEDEDQEEDESEEEIEMVDSENNEVSSATDIEDIKLPLHRLKVEDDASMDSISSCTKSKKKRRSHAEAFILDNQKYYKFETPGSSSYRLRYHGSYLSPVPTRSNGDCETKIEPKSESKVEKQREIKNEKAERLKLNLDDFKFSFETVPENEKWYQTFRRQDRSEERYRFTNNYHWDDFVMPYHISNLKPVDPRICYLAYKDLLKECQHLSSHSDDLSFASDLNGCDNEGSSSSYTEDEKRAELLKDQTDEDSKLSEMSLIEGSVTDEVSVREPKRRGRKPKCLLSLQAPSQGSSGGKNPRKSPRQHASTLAILSSLVNQRRRRSRNVAANDTAPLPTIPEEPVPKIGETKPVTPQKPRRKKIDYFALAAKIDEELDAALDENMDFDLEPTTDPDYLRFKESRLNVNDIMTLYEETTSKENENSCRRFFNGAPGRKPGKRKKNKTGWPNKVKRRKRVKEGENESTNGDVNNIDSDDDEDDEDEDSDSIIEVENKECNTDLAENKCDHDIKNRVGKNSEIKNTILQPYVYVKKLDNYEQSSDTKVVKLSKRTVKKPQRRKVTTSPKSPRMLRRSKGRWYRDR